MIHWVYGIADQVASAFPSGSAAYLTALLLVSSAIFVLIGLAFYYIVAKLFQLLHLWIVGYRFLFQRHHANFLSLILAFGICVSYVVVLYSAVRTGEFEYSAPRHSSEHVSWNRGHSYFGFMLALQGIQLFGLWAFFSSLLTRAAPYPKANNSSKPEEP